jgi:HAD domain in Swiss Army Knife RNA repair proteins
MAGRSRILLFLDVDGPLIPFGGPPRQGAALRRTGANPSKTPDVSTNPLLARLDPEHGSQLMALGCDLVWASSWVAEANEEISPRIGLPRLPVVDWPRDCEDQPADGVHWKTPALVAWAAGRPFVWVDDEIGEADRSWVARHHPGRALLHRVDPRAGLADGDFAVIGRWLARERTA